MQRESAIDLYWLPLGAGGHSVRLNGRVFEAIAARLGRRSPCDLYHSALELQLPEGRYVIEMTPTPRSAVPRRAVAEGPVGSRLLRRLRLFRYEIRCWRDGVIPDVAEAVDSPQRLSDDPATARRILELVGTCPTPVWGARWNSNSLIAWLIAGSGIDPARARLPAGGRAPGWDAGISGPYRIRHEQE